MQDIYADISRGIFLVRGENVLMLGEIVCTALIHGFLIGSLDPDTGNV